MTEFRDDHKVNLTASVGQGETPLEPVQDTPFSILVIGDFGGRGAGARTKRVVDWRPVRVTPENVLDLAGFSSLLPIPLGDGEIVLEIDGLEAFHPDQLMKRVPLLQELAEERKAVLSGKPLSDRFASPAPKPGGGADGGDPTTDRAGADPGTTPPTSSDEPEAPRPDAGEAIPLDGLLDAVIDKGASADPGSGRVDAELEAFVREAVRPHLVSEPSVDQSDLERLDSMIHSTLRTLLRAPGFSRMEALWRSLVFLLSQVETSGKTRVYIADVTRDELDAEVAGDASSLLHLLGEPGLGPAVPRWGCVVGAYEFGAGKRDVATLAELGAIASAVELPWLTGAGPEVAGFSDWASLADPTVDGTEATDLWNLLRETAGSNWLGLVTPPFLCRDAYGGEGRRSRVPGFEEAPEDPVDLPWGSAAFVWAALLGQAFGARGWSFAGSVPTSIGQMPVSTGGGDAVQTLGPARVALPVSKAETLRRSGVAPLIGLPLEASVRMAGFGSLGRSGGPPGAWWQPPSE